MVRTSNTHQTEQTGETKHKTKKQAPVQEQQQVPDVPESQNVKPDKKVHKSKKTHVTEQVQPTVETQAPVVETVVQSPETGSEQPQVVDTTQETPKTLFDQWTEQFKTEYALVRKQLRNLKAAHLKLVAVHRNSLKRLQTKKSRKSSENKGTGFNKMKKLNKPLAEYLGLEVGSELTTPQIARAVWQQIELRGLKYKGDGAEQKPNGRVFVPDKVTKKVFKITDDDAKYTVLDSEHGFNMYTLQSHIKKALS